LYGQALIRRGKVAEGIVRLKAAIALYEATGGKVRNPTLKAFMSAGRIIPTCAG
jgi:hypothetical protein